MSPRGIKTNSNMSSFAKRIAISFCWALTVFVSQASVAQDIYSRDEINAMLQNSPATNNAQILNEQRKAEIAESAESEISVIPEVEFERFMDNPENFYSGPPPTDVGFKMTQKLLGPPANYALSVINSDVPKPENVEVGATAFTYLLRVSAYLGTFLSMLLIGYLLVGGMLNMARDGDFLGKDWDSFYAPVRAMIGSVGTLPAPWFGGLNLAQMFVLIAFLMGLGIGSAALVALSPILMSKPLVSASFNQGKIEDMARSVGAMQICGMVQAKLIDDNAISEFRAKPYLVKTETGIRGEKTITVHANIPDWQTCGYITQDIFKVDTSNNAINKGFFSLDAWESMFATGSGLTNDGYIKAQIQNYISERVISDAVPRLIEDIMPIAAFASHPVSFADDYQAALNGEGDLKKWGMQYWYAIDAFQLRINSYAAESANSEMMTTINGEFTEMVKQNGMMLGGAYHNLISKRQNAIAQAIEDSLPNYESLDLDRLRSSPWYRGMWSKIAAWWNGLWTDANASSEPLGEAISVFDQVILSVMPSDVDISQALMRQKDLVSGDSEVGRLSTYINMTIAEWVTGIARVGENTSKYNPDPILEMHSLGVTIQHALMTGYAVSKLRSMSGDESSKGNSGGPISSWGSIVFASLLGSLLLITFLYTIVIPSLPTVMFMVSALGLFLFLIKALIAAPFWWAMHSHPVGRDLFGKAGPGYPLVLTLLLSPFLMVAGLIAAMALTRLSGWFVNILLMPSINIMNDGFTAPTNFISYYVIYGITMLVLVYKNYGLMYELRQVVLKWMGVDNAYTDFGERDAQLKAVGLGAYAGTVVEKGQAQMGRKGGA